MSLAMILRNVIAFPMSIIDMKNDVLLS